jgi:hypothetical protein
VSTPNPVQLKLMKLICNLKSIVNNECEYVVVHLFVSVHSDHLFRSRSHR